MRFVSFDYSMSNPCMCVLADDNSFANSQFYFLTNIKSYANTFGNVYGEYHKSYLNNIHRYSNIADFFLDKIESTDKIMMEDYALRGKGAVYNIAENTAILKYKLYEKGINFSVVSPLDVKKRLTGKGGSDKNKMYDAFLLRTGVDLRTKLSYTKDKIESPISDIVDSYAIGLICKGII